MTFFVLTLFNREVQHPLVRSASQWIITWAQYMTWPGRQHNMGHEKNEKECNLLQWQSFLPSTAMDWTEIPMSLISITSTCISLFLTQLNTFSSSCEAALTWHSVYFTETPVRKKNYRSVTVRDTKTLISLATSLASWSDTMNKWNLTQTGTWNCLKNAFLTLHVQLTRLNGHEPQGSITTKEIEK